MNTFSKFAIAASALTFASSAALAAPIITMTVSSSGATGAQCAAASGGAGTFAGDTCTISATNGVIFFSGGYGNFDFEESRGVGNGDGSSVLEKSQPALWLNAFSVATSNLGSMQITLTASGYDSPNDPFQLMSAMTGLTDAGMAQSAELWFDGSDSGVAGVGIKLMDEVFTPGSVIAESFNVQNSVSFVGTYGLSWIYNVERTADNGDSGTATFAATNAAGVPAPAPLALLGLGLMGIGFIRRQRA